MLENTGPLSGTSTCGKRKVENESYSFSMVVAVATSNVHIHPLGICISKDKVHFGLHLFSIVNMNSIP